MAHRFKVRQLAYAQTECCEEGKDPVYEAVVVLARLTEQGLDGTEYGYRVSTSCGKVGEVKDEDMLSEAEFNGDTDEEPAAAAEPEAEKVAESE